MRRGRKLPKPFAHNLKGATFKCQQIGFLHNNSEKMSATLQVPPRDDYTKYSKAQSTDDEFSQEKGTQRVLKTNICKYKTEMCKNYSEMGYCPYKGKCQFAHGYHELAQDFNAPKKTYRTKKCRSFWEHGVCRYGFRCQFSHNEVKKEQKLPVMSLALEFLNCDKSFGSSRLERIMENTY